MTTFTWAQGTRSSTVLNLGTLAAATFICSSAIDLGAAIPADVTFEVEADANGTPSGNKQLALYAKFSLDNTNWGTGPESGTTVTEVMDLHSLGVLPMNDTNTHRKFYSLEGQPKARYMKLVAFNDLGVALTSGNIYQANIAGNNA
jgi:hypothetical protein